MRNDVKSFILASIISADTDKYTEDVKQEIMRRYELEKDQESPNWEFILEPTGVRYNKILELFLRSGE